MNVPTTDADHGALDRALDALSDDQWAAINRIATALEAADGDGLTPSRVARRARICKSDHSNDTAEAARLLDLMVAARLALTSGNGAWTHYHAYDRYADPTLPRSIR